jgi:hypothetical protein
LFVNHVLIKVPKVVLQVAIEEFFLLFILLELILVLQLILVLIAFVESPRARSMFRPRTKAHPTEFMLTSMAFHVVAALVLFNRLVTGLRWAGLGVCNDPGCILALI